MGQVTEAQDGPAASRGTRASPVMWWATALIGLVGTVMVAYTTSWLWFGYRPGETFRCSVGPMTPCVPVGHMQDAGRWHIVGLVILSVTALSAALLAVLGPRRHPVAAAIGVVAALASTVAAVITPRFLWEQLGLWAVGTGQQFAGLQNMNQEEVRFAIVAGTERGPTDLVVSFTVTVILTIGAIVLLTIALLMTRPRRSRPSVTHLEMWSGSSDPH
ncbi:MAG: hypothetical protein ACHQDC_07205 [Acidimicrobiales bacterium]